MTRNVAVTRYANLSIILHWLMLALFVGVYASVELKGMLPRGSSARSLLMGFHGLFGLSIFALVWLRLLGRLTPRPPIIPKPPAWQTGLSHLMHLALYVLMIATPILAWLMLAAGRWRQRLSLLWLPPASAGGGRSRPGQAPQVLA